MANALAGRRLARLLDHLPLREPTAAAAAGAAAESDSASAAAPGKSSATNKPFVDREHFDEHGFVIVRDMLTEQDLAKVEADYDVLVNQRAQQWLEAGHLETTHGDLPFDRRLAAIAHDLPSTIQESELKPFLHSMDTMSARCKGTFDFFFSEGLLAAVEQIVGPEITLNPIQHIRPYIPHRYGGGYGSTTWHQDQAVTQEEADGYDILTCWIPFTKTTTANGALRILKNVAKRQDLVVGHHEDEDIAELWPGGEPVDCLVGRGDAVFISAYTPHRGTLNSSDTVRWSMDLRFQRTGTPTGRPAHPAFVLQSREDPSSVDDSFDEWCRRWVEGIENVRSGRFPHGHRQG